MDFAAEGLLDGLDGEARASREQLLTHLVEGRVQLEELQAAIEENRLALLPVDRVLGGTLHRRRDRGAHRAPGRPADPDPPAARAARAPGPRSACSATRTSRRPARPSCSSTPDSTRRRSSRSPACSARAWRRLSATVVAAFARRSWSRATARRRSRSVSPTLAEQLTPATAPILVAAFKAHLRESVGGAMLSRAELETGDVGRSRGDGGLLRRPGGLHPPRRPGRGCRSWERWPAGSPELAATVDRGPGAADQDDRRRRHVRQPGAGPARAVALALVEAVEEAELPASERASPSVRRCMRAGDYYGNSVNLASRVTGVARPGSVLCTKEIRDAAGDDGLHWSRRGGTGSRACRADPAVPRPPAVPSAAPAKPTERRDGQPAALRAETPCRSMTNTSVAFGGIFGGLPAAL